MRSRGRRRWSVHSSQPRLASSGQLAWQFVRTSSGFQRIQDKEELHQCLHPTPSSAASHYLKYLPYCLRKQKWKVLTRATWRIPELPVRARRFVTKIPRGRQSAWSARRSRPAAHQCSCWQSPCSLALSISCPILGKRVTAPLVEPDLPI